MTAFTSCAARICVLLLAVSISRAAEMASDLQSKTGRGTPPPHARGNGPWATRVMLATSTNGLDFTRLHFVLSDQAGVPNVMLDDQGRARVYYIDFGNSNVMACAIQAETRSLTNWLYRRVHIAGLPRSGSDPVDPTVVLLSNNTYRLYFMQARPRPAIYSALSTNGVDFVAEEGVRFDGRFQAAFAELVFDPIVLRTGLTWRLWCGPDGRFTARSTNGVAFEAMGEFKVEGARFMPWSAVALPKEAGYRLYGNFLGPGEWSGGVSSVFSRDAVTWVREPGIRLSLDGSRYRLESRIAPDNGCALLSEGRWLMAYLATIPVPRRGS